MGVNQMPDANFTPQMAGYSGQGQFRFWCQKVLPIVYDDSLSYYELLNKIVVALNNTINDMNAVEENTQALLTAYNELQGYVNSYFDSLDVQQEVNNKLDEMAESGELGELIEPVVSSITNDKVETLLPDVVEAQLGDVVEEQLGGVVEQQLPGVATPLVPGAVEDWLEENVDPNTTPIVDTSLLIAGAAADSKMTGIFRNGFYNKISNEYPITPVNFEVGSILFTTGEDVDNVTNIGRSEYIAAPYAVLYDYDCSQAPSYDIALFGYVKINNDYVYLGYWDGRGFWKTAGASSDPYVIRKDFTDVPKTWVYGQNEHETVYYRICVIIDPISEYNFRTNLNYVKVYYGPDTTLTLEGGVADAKSTGDRLTALEQGSSGNSDVLNESVVIRTLNRTTETFEQGSVDVVDGSEISDNYCIRMVNKVSRDLLEVKCSEGYRFGVLVYSSGQTQNFLGVWHDGVIEECDNWYEYLYQSAYGFSDNSAYQYRVLLSKVQDDYDSPTITIAPSDGAQCGLYYATDKTLSKENVPADAKTVGDTIIELAGTIPDVDATLSVSGAAADAKVAGEKITQTNDDLTDFTGNQFYRNYISGYITTSGSTASIENITSNASYVCMVVSCSEGDSFGLVGEGANNGRLWAFLGADSGGSRPVLAKSLGSYLQQTEVMLVAPANAEKLVVNFKKSTSHYLRKGEKIKDSISSLDEIAYSKQTITDTENAYINYSNGSKTSTTATKSYKYRGKMPKKVKAFLTAKAGTLCAIAFYSDIEINTSAYLGSESVVALAANDSLSIWYSANVPSNCKLIVFTTETPSVSIPDPIFLFSIDSNFKETKWFVDPLQHDKFTYHYNMNQVSTPFNPLTDDETIVIPSESIIDIQIAARLGFRFIELNCQKTSDGKYVVTHGLSGALGYDFNAGIYDSNTGIFTVTGSGYGTVISQTTYANLRANYRYRSIYPKYQTPICSLEEALVECLKSGIIPFFGYVDNDSLDIVKSYFGNSFILYEGNNLANNLRYFYDGLIYDYLDSSSYSTVDAVIEACKKIGYPCVVGIGRISDFENGGTLTTLIEKVHETGNFVGAAYISKTKVNKYLGMGVDTFASTNNDVNSFLHGNKVNLRGDADFDGFTFPPGALSNGVVSLSNGEDIGYTDSNPDFLSKQILKIRFNGTLQIRQSFGGTWEETSDGSSDVVLSYGYINHANSFTLRAVGAVEIYDIQFCASKC